MGSRAGPGTGHIMARGFFSMLAPLRMLIWVAAILAYLIAAPTIARELDRKGLPGGPIVLAFLGLFSVYCFVVVRTLGPDTRRQRVLARFAEDDDRPFRARFRIPSSLRRVPGLSYSVLRDSVANLIVVRNEASTVLVFDRLQWPDVGYAPPHRFTYSVMLSGLDLPRLVIVPKGVRRPESPDEFVGSAVSVKGESSAFDRRYEIRTWDRFAATAFIDARMLAWLLDTPDTWTFEAGGRWISCSGPIVAVDRFDEMMEALEQFRTHIPRVVASLYPPADPGFG